MATQACELRMHGVPFLDGENLKTLYHKLCFSLLLTPPPKFTGPEKHKDLDVIAGSKYANSFSALQWELHKFVLSSNTPQGRH